MIFISSMKILLVALHGDSSIPLFVLDHFPADHAIMSINATDHTLPFDLCRGAGTGS